MNREITKKDIIEFIASSNDLTIRKSKEIYENLFEYICDNLVEGNEVDIVGFGKFYVKDSKGRTVTLPNQENPVTYDDSKFLSFKSSRTFNKKLK